MSFKLLDKIKHFFFASLIGDSGRPGPGQSPVDFWSDPVFVLNASLGKDLQVWPIDIR